MRTPGEKILAEHVPQAGEHTCDRGLGRRWRRVVWPKDGDELATLDRADSVRDEIREQQLSLPTRKLGFQAPSCDQDDHPTAELDAGRSHWLQPCCNVLARARIDNRRADQEEAEMAKLLNCECGYVARGETDEEVLADLEAHIRLDHPEMVGKYTREDLLDLIEEA
jgi:predicted small metal-binding protein